LNEFLNVGHRDDGTLKGVPDVFNVKDFGAGNGVDDTGPVQNAINAMPPGGGTLYFPPGVYFVNATIDLRSRPQINMLGAGNWITNIRTSVTNTPGIIVGGINPVYSRMPRIAGFYLSQVGNNLPVDGSGYPLPSRSGNYGIKVDDTGGTEQLIIERMRIACFGDSAIRVAGPTGPIMIRDCDIHNNAGYSVEVCPNNRYESPQDLTIKDITGHGQCGGIYVCGSAGSLSISDCDMELNVEARFPVIYLDSSRRYGDGRTPVIPSTDFQGLAQPVGTPYGVTISNCSVSASHLTTPAAVVVIEGVGHTIIGGINCSGADAEDNILMNGISTYCNTFIGGWHSGNALAPGSTGTGYIASIRGAVHTNFINLMNSAGTYTSGRNSIICDPGHFVTATGMTKTSLNTVAEAAAGHMMVPGLVVDGGGISSIRNGGSVWLANNAAGGDNHVANNAYYNSGWKYRFADEASKITQSNGAITLSSAQTGSADSALTWVDNMIVGADGRVSVNGDFAHAGTGKKLGFFGAAPVVQPAVASGADVATVIAALKALGLFR
jgi:hypothetical protein